MFVVLTIPAFVSLLALAAHFLRENQPLFTLACLVLCLILVIPRPFIRRLIQGVLLLAGLVWIHNPLFTLTCLVLCLIVFIPPPLIRRLIQGVLLLAAFIWINTAWSIAQDRMAEGRDFLRAALILLAVAAVSLLAAALFQVRRVAAYYDPKANHGFPVHGFPVVTPQSPDPAPTPPRRL